MRNRHLQKRARTVRTLLKSLSANYRNGCPHITEKGVRELVKPAGRIGEALDLPSATLSFHLKELKHAGLVTVQREGRSLIYSADFATMTGLIDYLTRHCCAGDPAACGIAPSTHAARKETA